MSCTFQEDLTAYVDSQLEPLRARQVEEHLDGCAQCQATYRSLRAGVAALAQLPPQPSFPGLRRKVLTRLDEPPRGVAGAWARWGAAFGMAAAAALVVATSVGLQSELKPESPEQLLYAQNEEVLEDFDVVGLDDVSDLEVIEHLHELEVTQ